MNAPVYPRLALVREPEEKPATIWQRSKFNGAQATLALSVTHLTRHTAVFQQSGSSWDRAMAQTAVRNCEDALAEFRALLAEDEAA